MPPRRYLVINGDDFGISNTANKAIIKAHREGCLTSASLMITGEASLGAIELAQQNPTLSVGLHLVLGCGKSVLNHSQIPNLVNKKGYFANDPTWAGLNYQFNTSATEELRAEIRAQLTAFAQTGLTLSHLDGHLHHHVNPVVLKIVLELAQEFSIPLIRLPYEEVEITLQLEPRGKLGKIVGGWVFRQLRLAGEKQLQAQNIPYMDRVYGLLQTGGISEEYLLGLIPLMQGDLVELYTHPDLQGNGQLELEALLSGAVRETITKANFKLVNYQEVINQA